jgi:dolichol-phosphate mannosyltransferase
MKLSVIIPARNEECNIGPTLDALIDTLRADDIDFEIVVVNDGSTDGTAAEVAQRMESAPEVVLVNRRPPNGFGRAVRTGLAHFSGDAVALFMADCSDHPADLVRCWRLIEEGYDCVFGSRFMRGSRTIDYPRVKLVINRIVNRIMQFVFVTKHDDLTNAFKVYRAEVIRGMGPLRSCHFNITIELSLLALLHKSRIARIPVSWSGRTWGCSSLKLHEMGRRYLCTLMKIWFERLLISDDMLEEQEDRVEVLRGERAEAVRATL